MYKKLQTSIISILFFCLFLSKCELVSVYEAETNWNNFYKQYHSIWSLLSRLDSIVSSSCKFSSFQVIGFSNLGYPIKVYKIGRTNLKNPARILISAGMHGRERSTSLVAGYAVESVCLNHDDLFFDDLLEEVEVIILPVLNPDGQERSRIFRTSLRKNLRKDLDAKLPCEHYGVDLNRNFPTAWISSSLEGSGPCSDTYSGPFPLSEPESASLSKFIEDCTGIRIHIDIHSFGQLILRGWAFKNTRGINEPGSLEYFQKQFARAFRMAVRNRNQTDMLDLDANFATLTLTGKAPGGTLMDYMMSKGIPSISVEIGPKWNLQTRNNGWVTKENLIESIGKDMIYGIHKMIQAIHPKGMLNVYSDKEIGIIAP